MNQQISHLLTLVNLPSLPFLSFHRNEWSIRALMSTWLRTICPPSSFLFLNRMRQMARVKGNGSTWIHTLLFTHGSLLIRFWIKGWWWNGSPNLRAVGCILYSGRTKSGWEPVHQHLTRLCIPSGSDSRTLSTKTQSQTILQMMHEFHSRDCLPTFRAVSLIRGVLGLQFLPKHILVGSLN